ncbi:MAG: hypothetical protein R8K50_02590 [Mariprofundus sp.]
MAVCLVSAPGSTNRQDSRLEHRFSDGPKGEGQDAPSNPAA